MDSRWQGLITVRRDRLLLAAEALAATPQMVLDFQREMILMLRVSRSRQMRKYLDYGIGCANPVKYRSVATVARLGLLLLGRLRSGNLCFQASPAM